MTTGGLGKRERGHYFLLSKQKMLERTMKIQTNYWEFDKVQALLSI